MKFYSCYSCPPYRGYGLEQAFESSTRTQFPRRNGNGEENGTSAAGKAAVIVGGIGLIGLMVYLIRK